MRPHGQFDTGAHAGRAEPGRQGRLRVRSLAARSLTAVLLAALAALLALPLQAQTVTTLVSNTGQAHNVNTGYTVGISGTNKFTQTQQFTTGDNADGYTLSSVQIYIGGVAGSSATRVSIYEADTSGNPDSSRYTLTNPNSITGDSINTFTAPANATLVKETNYFVIVEATSGAFDVGTTASNLEDSGKANEWSINNRRHSRTSDSGSWSTSSNGASNMRISVMGTAILDTTAPVLSSTSANGTKVVLVYDEALDEASEPAASAYSVSVAGAAGVPPSSVDVSGQSVMLTLATAVTEGQAVTVSYTVPASNPIQDITGNAAAALTAQAVDNHTTASSTLTQTVGSTSWTLTGARITLCGRDL